MQSNSSDNCIHHYSVKILNFFDPELQFINAKPMIKNKLKALFNEMKFKTYLGIDAVYNFMKSMIEEKKYCIKVMKKHFNKALVMTKKDNEDFKNST